MVVYSYNPSFSGGRDGDHEFEASPGKVSEMLSQKQKFF
jgi:hypothetical protein